MNIFSNNIYLIFIIIIILGLLIQNMLCEVDLMNSNSSSLYIKGVSYLKCLSF